MAKDALGNDVKGTTWLKTHAAGDRSLTQGLKVWAAGALECAVFAAGMRAAGGASAAAGQCCAAGPRGQQAAGGRRQAGAQWHERSQQQQQWRGFQQPAAAGEAGAACLAADRERRSGGRWVSWHVGQLRAAAPMRQVLALQAACRAQLDIAVQQAAGRATRAAGAAAAATAVELRNASAAAPVARGRLPDVLPLLLPAPLLRRATPPT